MLTPAQHQKFTKHKTFRLAPTQQHTLLATNLYHNNQPPTIQIHHQSSVKPTHPIDYPKPLSNQPPHTNQIKCRETKTTNIKKQQQQHQPSNPNPSPIFFYQQ